MPELTGTARDRIQNDIDPVIGGWSLPTEMHAFLAWLEAHVEGRSDAERLGEFEGYLAFRDVPASLKRDLQQEGLLD